MDTSRQRGWLKLVLQVSLLTFTMWLVLAYSLFGLSDRLDKYIQDLVNSHFGQLIYPREHQDDVVVLLLNDEIVASALDGQWPAPYTFHASVLDDLLMHAPRAVFIDFFWMNRLKPGSDYLRDVLVRYKKAGIPVYLAAPSVPWFKEYWPELAGLVKPVSPHIAIDPTDFVARTYPQKTDELHSPAFAIGHDLLQLDDAALQRGDLDIFWGTAVNEKNARWLASGESAEGGLLSTFVDGFSSVTTELPYTTTVFVRDLINPVAETEEQALAELDEHLNNKIVVYGANLAGIQDVIFTPTRNILPGAYYHAMAIDNLLTWGAEFKASLPRYSFPAGPERSLVFFQVALLLPIAIYVCVRRKKDQTGGNVEGPPPEYATRPSLKERLQGFVSDGWSRFLTASCGALPLLSYVAFVCFVQFAILDLSVAVWAGFLEILGAGALLERLQLFEKISQTINNLRKGKPDDEKSIPESDRRSDDLGTAQ